MQQDLKLTAITLTEENGDQARNLGSEGKGEGSEGVVGVEELGVWWGALLSTVTFTSYSQLVPY